jgi:hypothetical protein
MATVYNNHAVAAGALNPLRFAYPFDLSLAIQILEAWE